MFACGFTTCLFITDVMSSLQDPSYSVTVTVPVDFKKATASGVVMSDRSQAV